MRVAGLLALWLLPVPTYASDEATAVFRSASASIVTVHAVDASGAVSSQGSGVVISNEVIVSNCHVAGKSPLTEVGYGGRKYPAAARHSDAERDLCSYDVPGLVAPSAVLGRTDDLAVGQSIYAIGAPLGLELTLSSGILSGIRTLPGGRLLQITAPISPGSSGGGLFDKKGRLVGITTLYFKEAQQVNFALPIEWVTELSSRHVQIKPNIDIREIGKQQLNAWESELRRSEPDEYQKHHQRLVQHLTEATKSLPPGEWVKEAARFYQALKDEAAAHDRALAGRVASAREGLNKLGRELNEADPATYAAVAPELLDYVREIASTHEPEAWVEVVRSSYQQLAARHKSEKRWELLYQSDELAASVDRETIEKRGRLVSVWVRTTRSSPTSVGNVSGVVRTQSRQQLNCETRMVSILAVDYFGAGGVRLASDDIDGAEPGNSFSIAPETVSEAVFDAVCR